MITQENIKITDPADVPADIVVRDTALTKAIADAGRERDRLRWESTMCPDGPGIDFLAYGVAVGNRDGKQIRESAAAWATHRVGCTSPEHTHGRELAAEDLPSDEDHSRALVRARDEGVRGAAAVAVAKTKGVSPVTVQRNTKSYTDDVREVVKIATEIAVEEGVAEPDDIMVEAAARRYAAEQNRQQDLRQRVKKAMMAHRGIIDFKDPRVAETHVAALITNAENIAAKPHPITGMPVDFEDALRQALEIDSTRVKHERVESEREKRQSTLVFELAQLLISVNLKLHQAGKILKQVEVKGIKPEQKERIEANLGRTRELLNLLEASVVSMEAVDWDKALADLLGEV